MKRRATGNASAKLTWKGLWASWAEQEPAWSAQDFSQVSLAWAEHLAAQFGERLCAWPGPRGDKARRTGPTSPRRLSSPRVAELVARLELLAHSEQEQGLESKEPFADLGEAMSALPEALRRELELRLEAAHLLGQFLDSALAFGSLGLGEGELERRASGSHFTPPSLARRLLGRAWPALVRLGGVDSSGLLLDPAVGGGAFLLEAALRLLLERLGKGESWQAARLQVASRLAGVDRSLVAVQTCWLALGLLLGPEALPRVRLCCADTLREDLPKPWPPAAWVLGNPPWVAYQGRAAQALSPEDRSYYRARYRSFQGYPTLQGMFVERATQLGPRALLTLLLPSSLADLSGYRATRACLLATHSPLEPLEEYGQDAFEGVTLPCFGLVALPAPGAREERAFQLEERARLAEQGSAPAPEFLQRLRLGARLPEACFREWGFQTNRDITQLAFRRQPLPSGWLEPECLPLLEGRRVSEFCERSPQGYLRLDLPCVAAARLRPGADWRRVDFVIRQTAAYPIAARHHGHAFRNSLLGGFAQGPYSAELLVALLNSSLFRALHLTSQRDGRQKTFPQVKIQHLRALPAPPEIPWIWAELESLSRRLEQLKSGAEQLGGGLALPPPAELLEQLRGQPSTGEQLEQLSYLAARVRLDLRVMELFGLSYGEAEVLTRYMCERGAMPGYAFEA